MIRVVLFLAVLFGLTWPWSYIARPLFVSGSAGALLVGLLPSVWAPTAVAVGLVFMAGGATEVRRELTARLSYRDGSARWLVLAVAIPIVVWMVAIVSARAAGDVAPFVSSSALPAVIGVQIITGATGEELGWRGYLLPRIGQRFGGVGAATVMASMWAVWHVPAFFTPGLPHPFMPMPFVLLTVAFFGVFLALVFNEAGESVLPTMLAHLSLNILLAIGGVSVASSRFWQTMAGAYGLIAIVVLIRLQRSQRVAAHPATV